MNNSTTSVTTAAKSLGVKFFRAYRAVHKAGSVRVKLYGANYYSSDTQLEATRAQLAALLPAARVYILPHPSYKARASLCVLFPAPQA